MLPEATILSSPHAFDLQPESCDLADLRTHLHSYHKSRSARREWSSIAAASSFSSSSSSGCVTTLKSRRLLPRIERHTSQDDCSNPGVLRCTCLVVTFMMLCSGATPDRPIRQHYNASAQPQFFLMPWHEANERHHTICTMLLFRTSRGLQSMVAMLKELNPVMDDT